MMGTPPSTRCAMARGCAGSVSAIPSWRRLRGCLPGVARWAKGVLSELATNAVIHAGTDFTVRISTSGKQRLHLSVTDGSSVMPRWAKDPHATDGRGLRMIDALRTEWGVMLCGGKGKTVWALLTADHMIDKDVP